MIAAIGCGEGDLAGGTPTGANSLTNGSGAGGLAGKGGRTLVTKLDPAAFEAGGKASVACEWQGGTGPNDGFSLQIAPPGKLKVSGKVGGYEISGTAAGSYTVTCKHAGEAVADANPPKLDVRAGLVVKTDADVKPYEVKAGEKAEVACKGFDAHGNVVAKLTWTLEVTPPERATAASNTTGGTLTGGQIGEGLVKCRAAEAQKAEAMAVEFAVVGGAAVEVVTAVAQGVVGQDSAVTCVLKDGGGNVLPDPGWSVSALPPVSAGKAPMTVTTTQAGTHPVACKPVASKSMAKGAESLKATPADAVFLPGKAIKLTATLKPDTIEAGGEGAKVLCKGADEFGNPTTFSSDPKPGDKVPDSLGASVTAGSDVTVNGNTVSSTKAGVHDVQCSLIGLPDSPPAKLTVKPGKPAFSKVQLPDKATAGVNATWTCSAHDQYGNAVAPPLSGWTLQAPGDCKSDPAKATVSCTKSGAHALRCIHKDVPEAVAGNLEVGPGAPVKLTLSLQPNLPNYKTGQPITVVGSAEDAYGNAILDPPLLLSIAPPQLVAIDKVNQTLTCGQDGNYTLTGSPVSAPKVKATLKFKVDSNGPLVSVSQPKRGATLVYSPTVKVVFSAVDELSKLGKVSVNGKAVAAGAGLDITTTVPAVLGLNTLEIVAEDEWGYKKTVVQSFYAADVWRPIADSNPSAGSVPQGLDAWLGQQAIDSGFRNHAKPKDLATVFEIVMKGVDLSAVVGASFPFDFTPAKGNATVQSFSYGDPGFNGGYPSIKLTAVNGGLYLDGTLKNVKSKVHLKATSFPYPSADATATAKSVHITGTVKPSIDAAGKVTVKTEGVQVDLVGLDVNVDNWWGFLVNWLIDLFNEQITQLLEDKLATSLATAINGPLANMLQNFALNSSFTVPGILGAKPATVELASALSALAFQAGGGRLGLKAAVSSKKAVAESVLGSFGRGGCSGSTDPAAALKKATPLEVATHLDVVNELLSSIWQTGALEIPISPSLLGGQLDLGKYGVTDLKATTHLLLPPLVTDCKPDAKPEMQIGDLGVDVAMKLGGVPVTVKAYAAVAAKVGVTVVQTPGGPEIALLLQKPHVVKTDVDIVLVQGVGATEATAAFLELLLPVVAGQLTQALGGTLASFPLPELDLSLMAASIPKGTKLALDVQSAISVPAYVVAAGKVK